jgi:hypothetical protein
MCYGRELLHDVCTMYVILCTLLAITDLVNQCLFTQSDLNSPCTSRSERVSISDQYVKILKWSARQPEVLLRLAEPRPLDGSSFSGAYPVRSHIFVGESHC